jgi:hypothetical protein
LIKVQQKKILEEKNFFSKSKARRFLLRKGREEEGKRGGRKRERSGGERLPHEEKRSETGVCSKTCSDEEYPESTLQSMPFRRREKDLSS